MANRSELVFTKWAAWLEYQEAQPRWKNVHYPLDLAVRWGVSKTAIYNALERGTLVAARVTGPLGENRLVIPDYCVREYEKNHLGRHQGLTVE